MAIEVRKLAPALGAEVRGIELREPLDDAAAAEIEQAWLAHHVLVFPDQPISDAQQVAFTRRFGELEIFPQSDNRGSDQPEIFRLANTDPDGRLLPPDTEQVRFLGTTQSWHTDSCYRPVPSTGAVLHALRVPPEGGDTIWINLFAVLEALPPDLAAAVRGRRARHNFLFMRASRDLPPMKPEEAATVPPVEHPLVRVHPDGRESLYISPVYMEAVTGLNERQTRDLVTELTEFATRPEFAYRHRWRAHDVLMWDNRCTMHCVLPYEKAHHPRVMHRTTLAGTGPVEAAPAA